MELAPFPASKPRTNHQKVRTGCRTCKIRRVKCDEAKPSCVRCTSTGRKCDGYEPPPERKWVVVAAPNPRRPIATVSTLFGDDTSTLYFDHFRYVSSVELSRFFGRSFWSRSLPQACHEFAAVRHALVSAATLFRRFKGDDVSSSAVRPQQPVSMSDPITDSFASAQYNKAIRHLIRDMSGPDQARARLASLICGILFTMVETLQGNEIAAVMHLEVVIKLLNDASDPASGQQQTIAGNLEDEVTKLVEHLDLEASLVAIGRPPRLRLNKVHFRDGLGSRSKSKNLEVSEEASRDLNNIMRHISHFIRSTADDYRYTNNECIPIEVIYQQQCLLDTLRSWLARYSYLWTAQPDVSENIALLQIHYHTATSMVQGCLYAEETIYDSHIDGFREIVRLSKRLNESSSSSTQPSFSAETRVVFPLFWVVKRCRDGQLRREALRELQSSSREGVWVPEIHSVVVQRVIEIEEEALKGRIPCSEDVLESWRVHCVGLSVDKERRTVRIAYQRLLNGPDGAWSTDEDTLTY